MKQKKSLIIKQSILGLFSALMLFAGIPKIILSEQPVDMLTALNYTTVGVQFIGMAWILCGIIVWFEHLRSFAALFSTHILAGAIATHVVADIPMNPLLLAYALLPLAVLYFDGFFHRASPELKKDLHALPEDLSENE